MIIIFFFTFQLFFFVLAFIDVASEQFLEGYVMNTFIWVSAALVSHVPEYMAHVAETILTIHAQLLVLKPWKPCTQTTTESWWHFSVSFEKWKLHIVFTLKFYSNLIPLVFNATKKLHLSQSSFQAKNETPFLTDIQTVHEKRPFFISCFHWDIFPTRSHRGKAWLISSNDTFLQLLHCTKPQLPWLNEHIPDRTPLQ